VKKGGRSRGVGILRWCWWEAVEAVVVVVVVVVVVDMMDEGRMR